MPSSDKRLAHLVDDGHQARHVRALVFGGQRDVDAANEPTVACGALVAVGKLHRVAQAAYADAVDRRARARRDATGHRVSAGVSGTVHCSAVLRLAASEARSDQPVIVSQRRVADDRRYPQAADVLAPFESDGGLDSGAAIDAAMPVLASRPQCASCDAGSP